MATITLTEETFEATVLGEGITIIDFWAEWCGPCKMFGPVFEKASEGHPNIKFAKVDTEAEQGLAAALHIQSIPTLMLFRDGILLFNQAGALPAHSLEQILTSAEELNMDEVRAEIEMLEKDNQKQLGSPHGGLHLSTCRSLPTYRFNWSNFHNRVRLPSSAFPRARSCKYLNLGNRPNGSYCGRRQTHMCHCCRRHHLVLGRQHV